MPRRGLTAQPAADRERQRERRRREIISESEQIAQRTRLAWGTFHDITPLCVGDPYQDPPKVSRSFAAGKPNFKSGKPKGLAGNDGCFAPHVSRKPVPDARQEDSGRSSAKPKAQDGAPPFRVGGGSVKPDDTVYALLGSDRNMTREEVKQVLAVTKRATKDADRERIRRIRERVSGALPNVMTGPVCQAMRNTVYLGSGGGPPGRAVTTSSADKSRKKVHDRPPFCSGSHQSGTFSRPSEVFIHAPLCASERKGRKPNNQESAHQVPFRPNGHQGKAIYEGYPKYMPFSRPASAKVIPKRDSEMTRDNWRPSSAVQSRPVRSVMLSRSALRQQMRR
mmetsp:Transcript_22579/g.72261  ORF Transcript_22579/g.72261 Transcript_22579/m.72261 type:complete len:337 (-) Transcript_22579:581-1591(-)